jgi:hypothetical protein
LPVSYSASTNRCSRFLRFGIASWSSGWRRPDRRKRRRKLSLGTTRSYPAWPDAILASISSLVEKLSYVTSMPDADVKPGNVSGEM